ncbi:MAG: autotransporter outer membrane beta-barrel domain-containing protein, partial [Stenotrophomonas sp.]
NNSVQMLGEVAVNVASGASATLAGNVSGGSSTMLVKRDAGTLTLGGGTVGETRVEGGTLRVTGNALNGGNIEIGSAGTFETDTTRVLNYAGQISGSGFLRQGRHALTLSGDSSAFTGTTVVNAGQLNVTGALGGDVQVTRGAWLTGNGSLGNVFVSGGSTLSPGTTGAAISRLDISGVLNFDSSATFQVDVAANGASDFVSVGGSALLGQANTVAVATNGDWATSTRYRLLTAAGGVNGTFAGATSTLAFLDPTLSYDANNVYLTMARNDVSMPDVELAFPEVVVNTNQREVATAVEALGDGNAVYDAVVRLEVPQVVPAFDSLSGEVHAATRGALLQNRFLHDGIDRHLDGRAMSGDIAPGVSVWLAGSGGQLRTDASAENAASRVQQNGMMAGAGWQVGEALELGVAAGQQQVDNRLRERAAVAETDATEYGVYAHYRWQGLSLRGGVTRADYRTDTTRTAQVGTAFSEQLLAREDATGTTAFVRAGWSFGGPRLQLTPEIELAQVRLESDGSQERGGDSALRLASGDSTYRTGLAALKADWDISGGLQDRAVLSARVGWQYADGDRLPTTTARFVDGSQDFTIAGAPLARSSVLAQLGVAVSPSANSRVSLQVQGRDGDGQRDVGAQLDWSVAF